MRSTSVLTARCSFQRAFCFGTVRSGITDYKTVTTTTGPDPTDAPTDVGRRTPEPLPCYNVPLPYVLATFYAEGYNKRNRCSGWIHSKCDGLLNATQYQRKRDWICDTCSATPTQQSSRSPTPTPPSEHVTDDSMLTCYNSSTLKESD